MDFYHILPTWIYSLSSGVPRVTVQQTLGRLEPIWGSTHHPPPNIPNDSSGYVLILSIYLDRSVGYDPASGHSEPQASLSLPGPRFRPCVWPWPELMAEPPENCEQEKDRKTIPESYPSALFNHLHCAALVSMISNHHWEACTGSVWWASHSSEREKARHRHGPT